MFCKNCGTKLENSSRFCPNCGKEVEKIRRKGLKQLLDFSGKKSLLSSILILLILLLAVVPLHILDSSGNSYSTYFINGLMGFLFSLGIMTLRNWKVNKYFYLLAILSPILTVLFSFYVELPIIFLILFSDWNTNSQFNVDVFVASTLFIRKGFVYYLIGAYISAIWMLITPAGGTYYVLWGLTLIGLFYIFKGVYFHIFPRSTWAINSSKYEIKSKSTK